MTADPMAARIAFPVAVLLRREPRYRGPWRYDHWSLGGVVTGEALADVGGGKRRMRAAGDVTEYFWTGLTVTLMRSNAETYWFNLTSTSPSLFVVCREDPESGLAPTMVTLDQDESTRQFEGDCEVFTTAIPEAMLPDIEAFIMTHYRPEPRRARRQGRGNED